MQQNSSLQGSQDKTGEGDTIERAGVTSKQERAWGTGLVSLGTLLVLPHPIKKDASRPKTAS